MATTKLDNEVVDDRTCCNATQREDDDKREMRQFYAQPTLLIIMRLNFGISFYVPLEKFLRKALNFILTLRIPVVLLTRPRSLEGNFIFYANKNVQN